MISIIVAASENMVIGKKGGLPWYIPEDLKRFKNITTGHPIIMGRKTHQSIGRPLPNRTNIIITRDATYKAEGCIVVNSVEQALQQAQGNPGAQEIFIIGGGEIYQQVMNKVERIYLTLIKGDLDGDVYFPDYSGFNKVIEEENHQSGDYSYKYMTLERGS
ncbi:hypothetical protein A3H85_01360 [Candidatus Daviesbacteria bacterium RIFCSPLOWO2_02_FULL_40_8]|uniref:Dihydrofolate reductase n=1 Tax=Candidatus Daviesbacteria bacterium RIFCSPLOWO2_01_FULL_40_24 TaxID=1797787 RepID=A0A1F5MJM2_9BACT|nr:MAG: hypothetical protein A2780_02745 [Candidatus Daviesbacteria bacterium RIFCSPHIGHO2_01_FULL_41_45]OGE35458.1 MAG: hypothetical protein A3C32_03320 [Candidatus Daviesbacteria bacterium RIFCSPHIGHO2_02_FULL_41_14]OGE65548.1 MAG: hypothetical protein A3B49_01900 [Candidatus Daviesbacteria bacterium RIFCSPLOWO2_01_FULL_40_24]OGE66927.1 MAG: hypothetical protein A3H85_01360 [Candidatus Daviesbacteria bacterium RIFCSPLOWO2_02_FULL_40_8]